MPQTRQPHCKTSSNDLCCLASPSLLLLWRLGDAPRFACAARGECPPRSSQRVIKNFMLFSFIWFYFPGGDWCRKLHWLWWRARDRKSCDFNFSAKQLQFCLHFCLVLQQHELEVCPFLLPMSSCSTYTNVHPAECLRDGACCRM